MVVKKRDVVHLLFRCHQIGGCQKSGGRVKYYEFSRAGTAGQEKWKTK